MIDATTGNPRPLRAIGDHGIIGDLDTAALVARDGTIDFLCWPHLDSPTIFAGLLDPDAGGAFEFAPEVADARTVQLYMPDTNVLITRWLAAEGSAELIDLMPPADARGGLGRCVIRRVQVTRGELSFRMRCNPLFDYARELPRCEIAGSAIIFRGHDLSVKLDASVPLVAGKGEAAARFTLGQNQEAWFVLGEQDLAPVTDEAVARCIEQTASTWRKWTGTSTYKGRWREQVTRSALALKLLTSAEHGSIAAAATFGLPEARGGTRNWDYRATWMRDASFTVYAFMRLGYRDEAEAFRHWVSARMNDTGQGEPFRIMYALDGSHASEEVELQNLAGYGGARPVRIGNAASHQRQLDIYGELLDAAYLSNKYGSATSHQGWANIRNVVDYVVGHWREADAGIWEMRDEPREFLHSRVMCWVALDRAVRLARKRSLPAPIVEWASERDRIAEDIWANFRHPECGHFVQVRGGRDVDASLLMMPLMRFVSATDPVWLATLDAIREELSDDGMIMRYRTPDGLPGDEGAFSTCSFWYVECLARAGRLDEAQLAMEKGLRYANHLGLFSEEISPLGDQMGNFPQALTHLAFISAAYFLDRQLDNAKGQTWQP